jgi:hypothetical protein
MMPTLVCVMRSGGDYKPEHVARLYKQTREPGRWPPGRFVCLTNHLFKTPSPIEQRQLTHGWAGWWSKLELCAPEHDDLGDILYIDLDTTVVGSLEDIANVGRLTLLSDFLAPALLASGVMYLPVTARRFAWELLHEGAGPQVVIRSFRRKGDQGFFNLAWYHEADRWQDVLLGQLISFKEHVEPSGGIVPWGARLICYHGHPRPWEVVCD